MSSEPIVEYEDVEFAYEAGTPVLRGIDLTVSRGEFITVIGQNGAGKSTFAKQFNGLLKPDSGSVSIHQNGDWLDTQATPMKTLASAVGYVFQNPDDQIFHTRVDREIAYGLKNLGVPEAERQDRIDGVLRDVDLEGRDDGNPFSMSIGERQRLAIAGVLVMEPDVIVVDEPTTGQDRTQARRIMEILRAYNERGHTIIVITHDMALAAAYTDRLLVMSDGTIIADGPPEEVFLESEHLEQTNIRPPQITRLGAALQEQAPDDAIAEMWLEVADGVADLREYIDRHQSQLSTRSDDGD